MSELASATAVRTVLLCDDQTVLRDAITLLLGNFPRFTVVGQAIDGASCLLRIADVRPDIVIMDVSLPGGGLELVRSARAASPDLQIVMFSGHNEATVQAEMLAAGADSYVVKTGRLKPLIDALDSNPLPRPGVPARGGPTAGSRQISRFIGPVHAGGGDGGHQAFFYGDDRHLVPQLAATAAATLAGGGFTAIRELHTEFTTSHEPELRRVRLSSASRAGPAPLWWTLDRLPWHTRCGTTCCFQKDGP